MLVGLLYACFDFGGPMRITGLNAEIAIGFDKACNIKFLNGFDFSYLHVGTQSFSFSNNIITLQLYLLSFDLQTPQYPVVTVKYAQKAYNYRIFTVQYQKDSVSSRFLMPYYEQSLQSGYTAFRMSFNNSQMFLDNLTDSIPLYRDFGDGSVYNMFPLKNIVRQYQLNFSAGTSELFDDFEMNYCYQRYNEKTATYEDLTQCFIGKYCIRNDQWNFTCFNEQFQRFIMPNKYVSAQLYLRTVDDFVLHRTVDYIIITTGWDLNVVQNSTNLQITDDYIKYVFRYTILGVEVLDFKNVFPTIQIEDDFFNMQYNEILDFYKFSCDANNISTITGQTIFQLYTSKSSKLAQQQREYAACKLRLEKAFAYLELGMHQTVNITLTNVVNLVPLARYQFQQDIQYLNKSQLIKWQIEKDGVFLYFSPDYQYQYEYTGMYCINSELNYRKVYLQQISRAKFYLDDSFITEHIGTGSRISLKIDVNNQSIDVEITLNSPQDVSVQIVIGITIVCFLISLLFVSSLHANS